MENKLQQLQTAEILFYLSGAFKNAIESGILAREHANNIFKNQLKEAGYEIATKKGKEE